MQDLLLLILQNITTQPDDVSIETVNEDGRVVFNITVHPDDMGRVIGKNGKVVQAIRSIMHVAAIRNDERVRVNVVEVDGQNESQSEIEDIPPAPSSGHISDDDIQADDEDHEETTQQTDSDIDLISGAIDLSGEGEKKTE